MSSNQLPSIPEHLTETWFCDVLLKSIPNATAVKLLELKTEKDLESGTLSTISRAKCVVTVTDGKDARDETLKLFIKIMPRNERFRAMANSSQMDKTEIETYKIFLPELEKFEREQTGKEPQKISPKLFAGDYDLNEETRHSRGQMCPKSLLEINHTNINHKLNIRSWYVMLEDLSETHFMKDFGEGLSLTQLLLGLKKIAHFHALTFSYGKVKGIKYSEKFHFFNQIFDNFEADPEVTNILNDGMVLVTRDLNEDENLKYLIPKLEGFREKMSHVFKTQVNNKDGNVVIHGDIWGNNFMFNKETDSDCLMVDWQFTTTGNPLFDFGPVAFLSMDPESTSKHLETILETYHSHLNKTCVGLGMKNEDLTWPTFEAFKRDALKTSLYITFVWSVLSYEVVKMFPPMRQRYLWVLKTNFDLHPELYN